MPKRPRIPHGLRKVVEKGLDFYSYLPAIERLVPVLTEASDYSIARFHFPPQKEKELRQLEAHTTRHYDTLLRLKSGRKPKVKTVRIILETMIKENAEVEKILKLGKKSREIREQMDQVARDELEKLKKLPPESVVDFDENLLEVAMRIHATVLTNIWGEKNFGLHRKVMTRTSRIVGQRLGIILDIK